MTKSLLFDKTLWRGDGRPPSTPTPGRDRVLVLEVKTGVKRREPHEGVSFRVDSECYCLSIHNNKGEPSTTLTRFSVFF